MNANIVLNLFFMIALKVLNCDAYVEPRFSCATICDGIDTGLSGLCCGNQYCDCGSGSDIPMSCPEGELFCDLIGDCVHIFGQECVEADFCCVKDDSTPEVSSTTQKPDDCEFLCDGVDIGFVGNCCGEEYCDCSSNVATTCPEGELFCDYIGDCVRVSEEECPDSVYCCSKDDSSTTTNMPDEKLAVLITGGHNTGVGGTVELFLPTSNVSCRMPQLPDSREFHTMDHQDTHLLCGGSGTGQSCLEWSSAQGLWSESHTLGVTRAFHVSWTPGADIGTFLMGGVTGDSQASSTLLKPDGSQEPGFPLRYDTRDACAIADPDNMTVIITGGSYYEETVSVYGLDGWIEDLPPLNVGRKDHACTSFISSEGDRVYLVTGGWQMITDTDALRSTELYEPHVGSWVRSRARLPEPLYGLKGATIDNRVLIFGGWDHGTHGLILEYIPEEHTFTEIGRMMEAREDHAVSVVQTSDFWQWCCGPDDLC